MTQNTLPFYLANLEDMTVAAVKAQAKIWCDTFRNGQPWNNGDLVQSAMIDVITSKTRSSIKPEDVDALEAKIVELTTIQTPIDEYEAKNPDRKRFQNGQLDFNRSEFHVDYHASGVLRAALIALGSEGEHGTVGRKLDLLVPCKSTSNIHAVGITASFGYGAPRTSTWNTLQQVASSEYEVINRWATDKGRYGEGWERDLEEGRGELVWVQLSRETVAPSVQIFKLLGYVKTYAWRDPESEYYAGNEGHLAYACSQVLQPGYLALAVRK